MLGLSHNLTKTVFVYLCICVHLCIWICVFGCQTRGNIVFEVLVRFPFQKYITSWVFSGFLDVLDVLDVLDLIDLLFVFVSVRRSYLISLYHLLFKNISHHGSFQGFTARELCGANKWMDGLDGFLCVG